MTFNDASTPTPVFSEEVLDRLRDLRGRLRSRICGQERAIEQIVAAILRRELGAVRALARERCLIFAGSTGVGKTETASLLAEILFGPGSMYRFDCGEFGTPDVVASLLGDTAGNCGRFGQAFRAVPRGIWLLDELEKAYPDFLMLLMAMTDAGRLTLASGECLDLSGLYLIATTNLGSAEIVGKDHLPFTSLKRHVHRAIERRFRPELLARFLEPIVFMPLDLDARRQVVSLHLKRFLEWHASKGYRLQAGQDVLEFLVQKGFSSRLGARPLQDAIHEHVGDAIVQILLQGELPIGVLKVVGNRIRLVR